jgi:hypothetical protein
VKKVQKTLPLLRFKSCCVAVLAQAHHSIKLKIQIQILFPRFFNFLFTTETYPSAKNLAGLNVNKIEIQAVVVANLQPNMPCSSGRK